MLSELAAISKSERARAKWALVSSHALGHTLGERMARESGSWLNVRLTTPASLAMDTAAPHLVEAGVSPIGDDLGAPLVMRLLRELPARVPPYFRSLAQHHAMGEAHWSAIVELRMAGVGAEALAAVACRNPAKHAELRALLAAYESWLARERRADQADIFRTALAHVENCPVRPQDLVIELPDALWPPLVRQFIDALPCEHRTLHATALPGARLPRRVNGRPRDEQPPASPLAWLMAPPSDQANASQTNLAFFRAGGPEAEVEEVFRRILHAEGGPKRLDDVEIACASGDYTLLLWQKAERYGWPITIEAGLPGTVTRPVRALLAWCDWVENGFAAGTLRRMLGSGDVRVDIEGGPGSGRAARLLQQAAPTWGRQTYALALEALAVSEREKAGDPERDDEERARHARSADEAGLLRGWIDSLLAVVPDTSGDAVPVQALVSAAQDFVNGKAAAHGEMDRGAANAIRRVLQRLRLLGDAASTASTSLDMIRAGLDTIRVAADRPRPGHLYVSTLARAGLAGRPFTFIVGLQEGEVFPAAFEDPVLLDVERERTHEALILSGDRTDEYVHDVVSRLACLRGAVANGGNGAAPPSICFSYSCQDLRDGRQTFASSLVLQAFRLTQAARDATFSDLRRAMGEPVSQVPAAPDAALADSGWWLANLKNAPRTGLQRVREAFPGLEAGAAAEAARASDAFTVYDGLAPSAAATLDPRRSGRLISPTGLERLAACPFAFFLDAGLGLDPLEDDERDPDAWLDPLTRGSVLHELFAEMMRHLRATKSKPSRSRHLQWLTDRADAALAKLRAEMPPPSEEVFTRERADIHRDLDVFLASEARTAKDGVTPIGFEVGFAGRGDGGEEPLSQAEPVVVQLPGASFPLNGRIDRIDRLADGTYQVVDYKTGSLYWPAYSGVFRHGRLLQHALYAIGAESLLHRRLDRSAKVTSGRYLFPTAKGAGRSRVIPRPPDRDVGRVVATVMDIAAAGAFMARTDDKDKKPCEYCDFAGVCGGVPVVKRAAAKLGNPANAALQPWRDLQEEENA